MIFPYQVLPMCLFDISTTVYLTVTPPPNWPSNPSRWPSETRILRTTRWYQIQPRLMPSPPNFMPLKSHHSLSHSMTKHQDKDARHLGIDISQELNWNIYINKLTTKANRTLGFMKYRYKAGKIKINIPDITTSTFFWIVYLNT